MDDASATVGTFTDSVIGLKGKTTYSFVAFATNYVGTSYSPVGTFTTANTPPTADAGGPYTMTEGNSLSLNASALSQILMAIP